jgi:8-oxo-dGTP pyrophosphatase MutT (NUDIX family)
MQLPVWVRQRIYQTAYVGLRVYWFLLRPSGRGAKCVLTDGPRVLLVRHTYGPARWELPGGTVHRAETPLTAARREMREELGLTIENWRELGVLAAAIHGKRDKLHCFHAVIGQAPLTLDRGEIAAAAWFERDALPARLGLYVQEIVDLLP